MSEGPTTDPPQGPVTVACRVCGRHFRFEQQVTPTWTCLCGRQWTFAESTVSPAEIADDVVVQEGVIHDSAWRAASGTAGTAGAAGTAGTAGTDADADSGNSAPWLSFILGGVVVQVIAGVILGVSIANKDQFSGESSPNTAGIFIGAMIGWVGAVLLFIGIIAFAVHIGTAHLRAKVSRLEARLATTTAD